MLLIALVGCTDYKLRTHDSEPGPGDTDTVPVIETDDTDLPVPTCATADLGVWEWHGSPTFTTEADPVDGGGLPFFAVDAALAWDAVTIPDLAIPTGSDRAYRAEVELAVIPPNLSLELQSDDGIGVWVNGTAVGHWGGAWQQEGCVNENASCLVRVDVDPVDVTGLLVPGRNVFAARVSNPVANAWFEIVPRCLGE
jgi:hypothetical protein